MRSISQLVNDTDPEELLPEDRHLMEVDFHQLATSNSNVRRNWASAVVAAQHVVRNLTGVSDSEDDSPRRGRNVRRGSAPRSVHRTRLRSRVRYQTQIQRRAPRDRRSRTFAASRDRGQLSLTDIFSRRRTSMDLDAEGSQRYRRRRRREERPGLEDRGRT